MILSFGEVIALFLHISCVSGLGFAHLGPNFDQQLE
jgi:hypothetical protein